MATKSEQGLSSGWLTDCQDWLSRRNTDNACPFPQLFPADEMQAGPFPLASRAAPATNEGQVSLEDWGGLRRRNVRR
jgi:hypothetical protein